MQVFYSKQIGVTRLFVTSIPGSVIRAIILLSINHQLIWLWLKGESWTLCDFDDDYSSIIDRRLT